jgi:hypothetical protein
LKWLIGFYLTYPVFGILLIVFIYHDILNFVEQIKNNDEKGIRKYRNSSSFYLFLFFFVPYILGVIYFMITYKGGF